MTPRLRIAAWIFVALAGLYALGTGGHVYTPDGVVMARVTESLVERGATDVPQLEEWAGFGVREVEDGGAVRSYAKFGLGQSLAAVPLYVVGKALAPLAADDEQDLFDARRNLLRAERRGEPPYTPSAHDNPLRRLWYDASPAAFDGAFRTFCTSWTNAWVTAATAAVLFLLCCELGFGTGAALATALLAALATPLWPFSKTFFSEPLAALGVTAFVYLTALGARRRAPARAWAAAGVALGVTVLAKPVHLVLVPPAALLLAGHAWSRPGKRPWRAVAAALGGLGAMLAIVALYDALRFGTPFETGYGDEVHQFTTPAMEGLFGLLLSPGRGLAFYFPLWLLAAAGAVGFARRRPLEMLFVALSALLLLGVYCRWHMWEGGWCWGPRFLLPLVPLLMLPAAEIIARFANASVAARAGVVAVCCAGFVVALGCVVVNFVDFHIWLQAQFEEQQAWFTARGAETYYDLVRWDWDYAPLVAVWDFPVKDAFLLPHALRSPGLVLGLYGLAGVALCVGTAGLVGALRLERRSRSLRPWERDDAA